MFFSIFFPYPGNHQIHLLVSYGAPSPQVGNHWSIRLLNNNFIDGDNCKRTIFVLALVYQMNYLNYGTFPDEVEKVLYNKTKE